jgi:RNA polymerase sigma-70 factor (ECF subfamily)
MWAEDVVQETFLAAFSGRRSFNPEFSFRTWLWTILLNLCKRHWNRRAKQPFPKPWSEINDEPSATGDIHGAGLACLVQAERVERIRLLLASLPEEQADALRLRFYGDLTFPEISTVLGCSISTAKSRVRYGLETIGRILRSEEGNNQ